MKYVIMVLIIFCSTIKQTPVYAEVSYARIMNNTNLYKNSSADTNNYNVWCQLESTYFVEVILDFNESLYKVKYGNLVGYAKKDDLLPVYSTPENPYPTNITTTMAASCYLRSTPTIQSSNTLTTISKDETITFIGQLESENVMDFHGCTWYLISYKDIIGYVYAGYTNRIGTIMPNLEQVSLSIPNIAKVGISPFSNIQSIWLTMIALIPTAIILYLLYKPKHKRTK